MTASTTTMASSTTMPMASTRPNIESVLTEKPSIGKKMNVPISDTGIGDQRDDRRADVLQEDEDHQRHQDQRLDERLHDLVDRRLDRRRGVVDDLVVHAGREQRLGLLHRRVDRLGRLELVGAGQQVDRHRAGRLAVQPPEGVVVLRAELGAADVLDADHRAGVALADDDVLELLRRDQAARRADRVGELLVLGRGRGADLAGGRLQVLLLDRR